MNRTKALRVKAGSGSLARRGLRRLGSAGMTLVETLVAIALTGIVAGVIVTQMVGSRSSGETAAMVQGLGGLSHAIQAFRGGVGRYPAEIRDLTVPPVSAVDLCGRSIPELALAEWKGPYLSRAVDSGGIPMGEATIQNRLRRDPAGLGSGSFGILYIDVVGVRRELAQDVELAFDGNEDFTSGAVVWTASNHAADEGTLRYGIPIRGC